MSGRVLFLCLLTGTQFKLIYATGEFLNKTSGDNTTSVTRSDNIEDLAYEDFIHINRWEMITLLYQGNISFGGLYKIRHKWFKNENNTLYLYVEPESRRKLWEEALAKYNGIGDICVDGICKSEEDARHYVEQLTARENSALKRKDVVAFVIMLSAFIIIIIVGVPWNCLIVTAVVRSKAVRNSTSILLCSLAVSDILVLAVCPAMQIIFRFFRNYTVFRKEVCSFFYYMKYFSVVVSVFTMTVMAVERYVAVCHPLKAKSYCTVRNARWLVVLVWLFSMAVTVPALIYSGEDLIIAQCVLKFPSGLIRVMFYGLWACVVFIIPFCIMGPLYYKILRTLWKSAKDANKLKGSDGNENKQQTRTRMQVVRMLITVLTTFVVCWGPAVLYDFITTTDTIISADYSRTPKPEITAALTSIGISNSFWNPVIYTAMSKQFKQYLKTLCRCSRAGSPKAGEPSSDGKSSQMTKESVADLQP